ncbi:MAG: aldolase [Candidatus Cloacimonadota bacterium]|nr:MAG: aldolase [Candidatus Cloacimonadota bacterium]
MKYAEERKLICEIGKRMYERGFVASNDGNISLSPSENIMLITPSGVSKGFMKPEEIVVMDWDGNIMAGQNPSSEYPMHSIVYKTRKNIKSVCHAHPVCATAFAVCDYDLNKPVLQEVLLSLGKIITVPYAVTGSEKLAKNLGKSLGDNHAFLLKNHGALTLGKEIIDAWHKMETLEHFAKIMTISLQIGNPTLLNKADIEKLNAKKIK